MCFICSGLREFGYSKTRDNPTAAVTGQGNDGTPTNGSNNYIDSLVWGGAQWISSPADPIRYWFGTGAAPRPEGSGTVASNAWSAAEISAFEAAFASYSAVANVHFAPAVSAAAADLIQWQVPANSWSTSGIAGMHEVPTARGPLDGWYNFEGTYWADLTPGGFGFNLILHELGHGMGLAHPHDGGGQADGTVFPGVSGSASTGINDLNQGIWTVMSYVDGWQTGAPAVGNTYGHAASLMAFDIAALQQIYGANMSYRTGADTYTLDATNGAGTGWVAIWDAGGTDVMSHAGGTAGATLDLRPAPLDGSVNAAGYVSRVDTIIGGFTIANGVTIENAIGGEAGDIINGNTASNRLEGRGGNDTVNGGSGGDDITGGAGNDRLIGDYITGSSGGGASGVGFAGPDERTLPQSSAHNSAAAAINLTTNFSRDADADIANATTVPHATVTATGNGALHFYRLDLAVAGALITLDIDRTTGGLDTLIQLRAADGVTVLASNDDSAVSSGAGGSTATLDSFLTTATPTAGAFYIVVGAYGSGGAITTLPAGASYELNISVADAPPVPFPGDGGVGGNDTLIGDLGNDTIEGGVGADSLDGGADTDTLSYAGSGAGVSVSLAGGAQTGGDAAGDTIAGFENLTGSGFNDTLTGDGVANGLVAGAGNDFILAGGGNDTLEGGTGADNLWGGLGADRHVGGDGADLDFARYDDANHGNLVINLANATLNTGAAAGDTYTGIEGLVGGAGSDTITGNTVQNFLFGGGAGDLIYGDGGNDWLFGEAGADNLWGGAGADQLFGGDGAEIDYARYDDANYGNLVINLSNSGLNTGAAAGDIYTGIEGLVGGVGNDTITGDGLLNVLFGGGGGDLIYGDAGNDWLFGEAGADNLWGGAGADQHFGGDGAETDYARYDDANYGNLTIRLDLPSLNTGVAAGDTYTGIEGLVGGLGDDLVVGNALNNVLIGGGGHDGLYGLEGNDLLLGGAGNDQFGFLTALNATTNLDTILDFTAGADRVVLSQAIFAGIGATLDAGEFTTGAAATTGQHRIIYTGGQLFFDADGVGGAAAVRFAVLTGAPVLGISDFTMV